MRTVNKEKETSNTQKTEETTVSISDVATEYKTDTQETETKAQV